MSRHALITQLNGYKESFPDEQETVDRFLAFVHEYEDCFQRTQLTGHVTGSAWLTNVTGTHVLLTHHRKLDRWLQLGGHADGNPDAMAVAMKEAREESGITAITPCSTAVFDIDIHEIPARGAEPLHYHYDVRFALRVTGSDEFIVSDESHALEWIEIENLQSRTTEASMLRMAGKWARLHG